MTIKELYEWAVENSVENYTIKVQCTDTVFQYERELV